ncbi:MAG: hypothetical protein EKK29_14185 [Hyphomicrobiales bacterium]|nr:MAG: hypothetical protein EKK29_14185 [Hyphomicrobiales bacterium]
MKKTDPRPCEIRISLERSRGELLRAFVREAALLEGAPPSVASLLAEDALCAFTALCALASGHDIADIDVSSSRRDLRCRIRLKGHARFSSIAGALGDLARRDAGLSVRERGVDGFEASFHRGLEAESEAPVSFDPATAPPPAEAPPAGDVSIDLPRREDAAAIARCFLAIYGHNYVHTEVFSPQRYWSRVESGALLPVVARDETGEVIGHVALERENGAVIAERGEAVVLDSYRGRHLLERMTERLSQEARKLGLTGVYALPVTLHTFSQRNDERAGMPVCAILLGKAPEAAHPKGAPSPTAGQRQSYLLTFRFLAEPPKRAFHAPQAYREIMLGIYESLGVAASPCPPGSPRAGASKTRISIDQRGYGKIEFEEVGLDAGVELAQALQDVCSLGARATQLLARVADPGLPHIVEKARGLGFFFCGVGPAVLDGEDVLMLQYLRDPLDVGKLQLFTDQARRLAAFIADDRASRAP